MDFSDDGILFYEDIIFLNEDR